MRVTAAELSSAMGRFPSAGSAKREKKNPKQTTKKKGDRGGAGSESPTAQSKLGRLKEPF